MEWNSFRNRSFSIENCVISFTNVFQKSFSQKLLIVIETTQFIFFFSRCAVFIPLEQQTNESPESTMTVETQQNHDRLLCKNGVPNNVVPASNSNGVKKSSSGQQQKDEHIKQRFTENSMQVCNVNLMENTLASR